MKKLLSIFNIRRQIAANVAQVTENIRLIIGAANNDALGGEEWEQITPWGEFPNSKGLQRITPVQGEALVKAFNSLAGKAKRLFQGVPIYVGHPDVDPKIYKDDRRYGKITALRVGETGLESKIAWNDLGEQNQKQGYWIYPSPVWYFKKVGGGVIEPVELASVGLTNTPNIPGSAPWSKNDREVSHESKTWNTGAKNVRAAKAKAVMQKKAAAKSKTKPSSVTPSLPKIGTAARAALQRGKGPASSSSGAGNHVHIHFGSSDPFGISQPQVAANEKPFAGKAARLMAFRTIRKTKPAAA